MGAACTSFMQPVRRYIAVYMSIYIYKSGQSPCSLPKQPCDIQRELQSQELQQNAFLHEANDGCDKMAALCNSRPEPKPFQNLRALSLSTLHCRLFPKRLLSFQRWRLWSGGWRHRGGLLCRFHRKHGLHDVVGAAKPLDKALICSCWYLGDFAMCNKKTPRKLQIRGWHVEVSATLRKYVSQDLQQLFACRPTLPCHWLILQQRTAAHSGHVHGPRLVPVAVYGQSQGRRDQLLHKQKFTCLWTVHSQHLQFRRVFDNLEFHSDHRYQSKQ